MSSSAIIFFTSVIFTCAWATMFIYTVFLEISPLRDKLIVVLAVPVVFAIIFSALALFLVAFIEICRSII